MDQPSVDVDRALPIAWQMVPNVAWPLSYQGFFDDGVTTGASVSATLGRNLWNVAAPGVHARIATSAAIGGLEYPGGISFPVDGNVSLSLQRFLSLGRLFNVSGRARAGVFSAGLIQAGGFDAREQPALPLAPGFAVGIDAELALALLARTDLVLSASYDRYFGYNDYFTISLGTRSFTERGATYYHGPQRLGVFQSESGPPAGPHLELLNTQLQPVFPILKNYYEESPFGDFTVANATEFELSDLRVSLVVPGVTDAPTTIASFDAVGSGETVDVDLTAVFAPSVLEITEAQTLNAQIQFDYSILGFQVNALESLPLEFLDRNAVQWTDDRRIASFMSVRDEAFKQVSNRAVGLTRNATRPGIDANLQNAMIVFEALNALGLAYVIDPSSAYEQLSQQTDAIDYVQFPRQTLYFRAGDCDDLSVAYNTLLESLGIETAFITIPGHIFTAFRLSMDAAQASRFFPDSGRIIAREDGSAWMPIETTVLDDGFSAAWAIGARQWIDASADEEAAFIRTRDAWAIYPPVQPVGSQSIDELDGDVLATRFDREMDRFVRQQVEPAAASLQARLAARPDDARTLNRLAVLYGRFGLLSEAQALFERLVSELRYGRAQVNLANTYLLLGDAERARDVYVEALATRPSDPAALAGAAQAFYELGDFAQSDQLYQELSGVDSQAASRLAFLGTRDTTTRASRADTDPVLFWGEEDVE